MLCLCHKCCHVIVILSFVILWRYSHITLHSVTYACAALNANETLRATLYANETQCALYANETLRTLYANETLRALYANETLRVTLYTNETLHKALNTN